MLLNQLNSQQFHTAVIAGCQALMRQKLLLNKINLFPVADGDTGDNLSSTAHAIIELSSVQHALKETIESIADASIIGARGNSGLIFSQFFNAMAKQRWPSPKTLDFKSFAAALQQSVAEIFALVSHPVHGTMLTLIERLAFFSSEKQDSRSFAAVMGELLPLLKQQVEQTKESLAVLKKANVVDAGALGFYFFIEGFTHFLQNPSMSLVVDPIDVTPMLEHSHVLSTYPEYRYCTEAVVKAEVIDSTKLLNFLQEQGDCALVSGNERVCRFHVHTNHPQQIFTRLLDDYTICYPKVDDMQRQKEAQALTRPKIALVTDSSADLSQDLLDKYQIYQLPLNIQLDEHQLLDKYSFESEYFYQHLHQFKHYPKTSCFSALLIEEKIAWLTQRYEHVLIICVSGAMSGVYTSFKMAARKYDSVTVIDSKTNSGAHGLLLDYAGGLINAQLDIETMINLINEAIKTTFMFVVVQQFKSMVRSGRMHKIGGFIAGLSQIKPIVSIDATGKGFVLSQCLSSATSFKKLIKLVRDKIQSANLILEEYSIVHADANNLAMQLAAMATETFNKPPRYIEPVSLAVGLHAGQGCVGLAVRMRKMNP